MADFQQQTNQPFEIVDDRLALTLGAATVMFFTGYIVASGRWRTMRPHLERFVAEVGNSAMDHLWSTFQNRLQNDSFRQAS